MELLFFAVLICLLGYVLYRNIKLISRYKHNKEYIECYKGMLNEEENVIERINNYINNEKDEEFKNKGRVLKLYVELGKDLEYSDTLTSLNFNPIFYKDGKLMNDKFAINVDIMVWVYLIMARARKLSKFDVLNNVVNSFEQMPDYDNRLEFQLVKNLNNALLEKEDGGIEFLSKILEGEYYSLHYEKSMVGLYKRIAASTLAYCLEPLDDYYMQDIPAFGQTNIGKAYLKDLDIYDKFVQEPEIEVEVEESQEEVQPEQTQEENQNTEE